MNAPIAAVLVHVSDVSEGLTWYEKAFPTSVRTRIEGPEFEVLLLDGIQLEIVPADDKVSSGSAGSVVYWRVANLTQALERLIGFGAALYRGPMKIENGLSMCQVRDPWGKLHRTARTLSHGAASMKIPRPRLQRPQHRCQVHEPAGDKVHDVAFALDVTVHRH